MFWTQIEESSINDTLTKKDVKLEEVLDHESLLQECRSQNENLTKFMTETSNFCKLLKYVLVTPREECNEVTRFKYPSLSCEVLTSDIPAINILLIKGIETLESGDSDFPGIERPFIDQLHDILSREAVLNPLMMSFCIKILLNILKFDNKITMNCIMENKNYIDVFLSHIDSNAIVHFFTEFIQCDDEFGDIRNQWLIDNKFVLKLAGLLGITEYKNNSIQLLFSNIMWCMSIGVTNKLISTELTAKLNEKEFLNTLFLHITNPNSDSSLVSTCLNVLRNIIELEISKTKEETLAFCIELIQGHFKSLVYLLKNPPQQMYDPMSTTVGVFRPFGPTRIEIVNLLECLLKLGNSCINDAFIENTILDILLNHVSEYKWNSQFHLSLLKVLDIVFKDLSVGNIHFEIQKHLVQGFGIYRWFIELKDSLEASKPRPGYSGILWKIGNLLDSLKKADIGIELLSDLIDIENKWTGIENDYLKPKNVTNEKGQVKYDCGLRDLDSDLNIVDIDEADIEASSNNQDAISDYFRNTSDNLNEIFNMPIMNSSEEEWINNELEMPTAPVDDYNSELKQFSDSSDDSSSSDEESPIVIKQKSQGKAAKYILSESHTSSFNELSDLPDVPESTDIEYDSLEFNDPWNKNSSDGVVQENWAKF